MVKDNFEAQRLKVIKLPNSETATRELLVEAEILTKISQYLRHPNLIQLLSVDKYVIQWDGKRDDRWFLVLQFGGENLRGRLGRLGLRGQEYIYRDGRPLAVEDVLRIAVQVSDGLRALHEFEEAPGQHVVHRDIKPENILIDNQQVIRLTDFGISKVVERLTQSVTAAGTPPYLAPEYSRGRLHACSDIYSLGIVLYEMATGRFPFRTIQDRFYEMPTPPHELVPDLPPLLSDAIIRCLCWDHHAERGQEEAQALPDGERIAGGPQAVCPSTAPGAPRYQPAGEATQDASRYYDTETTRSVRVYLYDCERPGLLCGRLAGLQQRIPNVFCPESTFESDNQVGVVAPLLAADARPFSTSPPGDVDTIQQRVAGISRLARTLETMHGLGVYHGLLAPAYVFLVDDAWQLDHIWLGPLVGQVPPEKVFKTGSEIPGYLAPEILDWRSPPTLSADVYGLGALLHASLAGTPPVEAAAAGERLQGGPSPTFHAPSGLRSRIPLLTRPLETSSSGCCSRIR